MKNPLKIVVVGASGKMGQTLIKKSQRVLIYYYWSN